jgi:hypothetical protein
MDRMEGAPGQGPYYGRLLHKRRLAERERNGALVSVYYSPGNPGRRVLQTGPGWGAGWDIGFGCFGLYVTPQLLTRTFRVLQSCSCTKIASACWGCSDRWFVGETYRERTRRLIPFVC